MPQSAHAARRERLRARLADHGLAGYLVTRLVNVRYLTGFTGSNGQVLVSARASGDVFATDGRYDEQAAAEAGDLPRVLAREEDWLPERLAAGDRVGFESHDVSWERGQALSAALRERAGVELVAAPRWVEELREVKDASEVAALRRACALADAAFAGLLEWLRPGMTERDVAGRLEQAMREGGADGPSFETIVASGPNSARPHHRPTSRAIASGDVVKVDFGALVDGYHSDMTRTVAVGEPDAALRGVHDLVRRAQAAGRAAALAGAPASAVDAACREAIAAAGHGERFVHPTGHAVGLEIHEQPILHGAATATLRAGMAVTVEPGVYLPGVGGVRIEDVVVVADQGPPEVLTTSPRELLVL
ncbi:MAG TPA: Xaa-Pro peptidase family protein [Egibacteraceae bacterium]|nr:Xaa-Pro peptidase family protein [Egibacteraceae bacterium]